MAVTFPVYRKYTGLAVWFKIDSADHFTEIKQLGSRYLKTTVQATQFPEKLLIQDMINMLEGRWEEADSEIVESLLTL